MSPSEDGRKTKASEQNVGRAPKTVYPGLNLACLPAKYRGIPRPTDHIPVTPAQNAPCLCGDLNATRIEYHTRF